MNSLEWLSSVATVMAGSVAAIAWRQRHVRGALELLLLALALTWWTLCTVVMPHVASLQAKVLWYSLKFVGVTLLPVVWFAFTARVTLDPVWLRFRVLAPLLLMPCITLILILGNAQHGLIFGTFALDPSAYGSLHIGTGPWWWVHSLYSYALTLAGLVLLIHARGQQQGVFRTQLNIWIAAISFPLLSNLVQQVAPEILGGQDLTPLMLTLTGIIVLYGLLRHRLLILSPIALETALDSLGDGIIILDDLLRVVRVNPAGVSHLRLERRAALGELAGKALRHWSALEEALNGSGRLEAGSVQLQAESSGLEFEYQITPIRGRREQVTGHLIIARDVTEVRRYQRQVQDLAFLDSLTNLSNRRALFRYGRERLQQARERGQSSALLYVDLDRFKAVNDALGHEIGDTLLVKVAERLRAQVKLEDLVSRNGGDEFTVLLEAISRTHADEVARRLQTALSQPYQLGAHEVVIGASIGVAMFPEDASSIEDLLHQADLKMYLVKTRNKAADVKL